jgi:hypothetical protein
MCQKAMVIKGLGAQGVTVIEDNLLSLERQF